MTPFVIAIDGPAASGKGTLARTLAGRLGYAYLDTGALYRLVGYKVLESGGDAADEAVALYAAQNLSQTLKPDDLQNPALRTDNVGQAASKVAKFAGVRAALLQFQKDFAAKPPAGVSGVILDGRDIGTVICPDAPVKLFVTASVEERSKRRYLELTAKGISTTMDDVLADMKERDARDSGRDTAPLKPADDAHILDTSQMDAAAVLEKALSIIESARGVAAQATPKGS